MPRVNDGLQSLAELNKNPVGGFSAGLIDDNDLYHWEVLIIGPPDTLYEGGVFKAYLIFPKDYPLRPPKMKFITDIWPPNGKLPLIWNKIKTGWSSLVPDTGKLSWPRQQSSVRKNSGSVSNYGTGRSPFHRGANIQLEWQYYQNKILKGEADHADPESGDLIAEIKGLSHHDYL
ncbi:uncharacterized protein LOC127696398 isoform X5 [Apodemus sylvaticus]|uniref:uncharacterized protein LOC127696398 isoform X5 n=1 Tax=Apodemus sylvaticus TaxID=10129 RepID=UPI0022423DDA|nr:uncharacterized protein LOC127696398 isoform X5 [Apodemus sylvaticus]XP_052055060.1 uncharacterized protein LOC127696398 isoform X5 [Apodemus sylvaticus]